MQLGNSLAEGQAETCPVLRAGARFIDHIEGLRDTAKLLLLHAAAVVPDVERVAALLLLAVDLYVLPFVTRLARVVHNVDKQGLEKSGSSSTSAFSQRMFSVSPSALSEGTVTAATLRMK